MELTFVGLLFKGENNVSAIVSNFPARKYSSEVTSKFWELLQWLPHLQDCLELMELFVFSEEVFISRSPFSKSWCRSFTKVPTW